MYGPCMGFVDDFDLMFFLPKGAPEVARNPCRLQVHVQEFSKQRVDLGVEIPGKFWQSDYLRKRWRGATPKLWMCNESGTFVLCHWLLTFWNFLTQVMFAPLDHCLWPTLLSSGGSCWDWLPSSFKDEGSCGGGLNVPLISPNHFSIWSIRIRTCGRRYKDPTPHRRHFRHHVCWEHHASPSAPGRMALATSWASRRICRHEDGPMAAFLETSEINSRLMLQDLGRTCVVSKGQMTGKRILPKDGVIRR